MASGSSGRATNSGSKSFDFGSDDILCSYEDYGNHDGNNGIHSDPSSADNSVKEFNKSRMARSSVYPPSTYSTPEESSFNQSVISTVDNTMKKYTDNIMRFLEGISSRLSQLELYCYNLDKSIGEMRSDFVRDHGESESKLKSLDKHIQEVHRSVQILRDKQELADTQKELAKLQLAQKESSSTSNKQQNEERTSTPVSEPKKNDVNDQQLALALPHQIPPHQQPSMGHPSSMPPQSMPQAHTYYLAQSQPSQTQYLPSQPQAQDPRMVPQPSQSQVNPSPQVQSLPAYQQQWSQPQPTQQIRTSSQMVYSSYMPGQPNPSPADIPPGSMPMQMSFVGPAQAGPDGMQYGYSRPIQQQPPPPTQQLKTGDGYMPTGPRPSLPPGNTYMVYDGEAGRSHHHHHPPPPQSHFQQNAYPQNPQRIPNSNMVGPPQSMRGHPYNELIEKLSGMGFRGDHVIGVIQRLEETGQPIDFNAVLDRLNGHSSGSSQRGWSG
ncbi:hypothetical protein ACS0TY_017449 [Phlomoides rotata]